MRIISPIDPPSQEVFDEVVREAEQLPRVALEGKTRQEIRKEIARLHFGNNFYFLFKAMRLKEQFPHLAIVEIYLHKAEAIGEPWQRFLSENTVLLAQLEAALREEDILSDLYSLMTAFYNIQDNDNARLLHERIHPELGLSAVALPVWRRLNELLKQAAEAMKKVGIDPEQFYG